MSSIGPSIHVGATIGRYKVLDAKNPNDNNSARIAAPIGSGATATVYLVAQDLGEQVTINRALKLFSPSPEIKERRLAAGLSTGTNSFLQEIKTISTFNHQNLVKITDAGKYENGIPFFVMEFVEGDDLRLILDETKPSYATWRERVEEDPFLVLRMARQLCWPLVYLHGMDFYHFDVAPKNIFVRLVNNRPHLIIGDLGVSKRIRKLSDLSLLHEDREIFIGGTRSYTPLQLHAYLNRKPIKESELAKYADYWDVYAVATILEEMIDKWGLSDNQDLAATKILCDRAKQHEHGFDVLTFTQELERLLPMQVLTAGVEELSSDAYGKRTYVNIPLYPVPISSRVQKVTSHPIFIRLQKVPQFLFGRTVFPGGVHSRYEHALGSYALGLRYLLKLISQAEFRASFSKKELEEAIIALLLTKITSFPLDYAFMELFQIDDGAKDAKARLGRLNLFLDATFEQSATLRETIAEHFPDADLTSVTNIVAGTSKSSSPQAHLIAGIIKSSIDVRVLDYLGRDSHHTGIPAGSGVDIADIISNLTWTESNGNVSISRHGVFSVEHLLCARYWMYNRVYWNRINRSLAAMTRYTIFALTKAGNLDVLNFIRAVMHEDEPGALRVLADRWNDSAGEQYKYASIIPLLQLPRPRSYHLLLELSGANWTTSKIEMARRLSPERMEALRIRFIRTCSLKDLFSVSSVLFDIPREKPAKFGEDLNVSLDDGTFEPLAKHSDIIAILPAAFLENAVKLRVFIDPSLKLKKAEMEQLRKEAQLFLERTFTRISKSSTKKKK